MDIDQLWEIVSKPDNVPIVLLMVLVPFYMVYGLRQAFANDRLIDELEADPELAKTHRRKRFPFKKGWAEKLHVWPYLLKIEFLAALIVMTILIVWSLVLDAPLEAPANPNLTMNPAKAPWYFLGLQEMLVYFDPWIAGVVLPCLIVFGLMAIPYIDMNPLGNGYYTYKQRKFSLWVFFLGFIVLWLALTFVGVFVRGPGWMPFWPGQTWDAHRVVNESYMHLYQFVGFTGEIHALQQYLFGAGVIVSYYAIGAVVVNRLYKRFHTAVYQRMNVIQYNTTVFLLLTMLALSLKILAWHCLHIKYIWITPWFNV